MPAQQRYKQSPSYADLIDNDMVSEKENEAQPEQYNTIKLDFDSDSNTDLKNPVRSLEEWSHIFPNAAFFEGSDSLFGDVIAIVYEDPESNKISTVLLSKIGETRFNSLTIDARSKYFPACENLLPKYKKSNVRRSLAITILRTYATLGENIKNYLVNTLNLSQSLLYDETDAGDLANSLKLIQDKNPTLIGDKLLKLGFLQPKLINSMVLDVIYSNEQDDNDNNKLVYLLGDQLDQLFDPLTEYSPETTEKVYRPPASNPSKSNNADDELISSIVKELLKVQTNFTINLVDFLQNFVVPLRIEVLNGKIDNLSITRLNSIFPPTIDEITRINCIFQAALSAALPFGSFEILKACGTTIPYFYKAYMRHEAATRFFEKKFSNFIKNYGDLLPSNINAELYTKNKVSSIVYGSLNLPKLKLILDRLISSKNWGENNDLVDTYYQSSNDTINAFGRDNLKPYDHRVFTPTGKLLTELANDWPVELQYGWLTRRVVGIFDAENLLNNSIKNVDVIIIFSDHILFLNIYDDDYYGLSNVTRDESVHIPAISDILMHSLINEIPLTNIPKMKVVGWANMNDVIVSTYNDNTCLEFFVTSDNIKSSSKQFNFTRNYLIKSPKLNNGSRIIELINKAKVLYKNQPFHLFKMHNSGLSVFSTAHNVDVYSEERGKSPFALFLNMKISKSDLQKYGLFAILSASFISTNRIQIIGFNQLGYEIDHILDSVEFDKYICEELSRLFSSYLSFDNKFIRDIYIQIIGNSINNINQFIKSSPEKEIKNFKDEIRSKTIEKPIPPINEVLMKNNIDSFQSIGATSTTGTIKRGNTDNYALDVANKRTGGDKKLKRRSFISRLFSSSKSNKSKSDTLSENKSSEKISKRKSIANFMTLDRKESSVKTRKSIDVLAHANDKKITIVPGTFTTTNAYNIPTTPIIETQQLKANNDVPIATKASAPTVNVVEYNSFVHNNNTSMTEENVHSMDKLHSTSVRQRLDELTRDSSDFYEDGEANWTMARDNSSLANIRAEVIRAETSIDTQETLGHKTRRVSENYEVFSPTTSSKYQDETSHYNIHGMLKPSVVGPYQNEDQKASATTLNDDSRESGLRSDSGEFGKTRGVENTNSFDDGQEIFYSPVASDRNVAISRELSAKSHLSASTIINSSTHSLYSLVSGHESVKVISKATRQPMTWYSSNDVDILKNVKPQEPDSFLVHEKSYQYLSDILKGDFIINLSDEENEEEEEEANCTETIFNKNFKESSLGYLSSYITSGRTIPKNLDKFEGEEDYYFV